MFNFEFPELVKPVLMELMSDEFLLDYIRDFPTSLGERKFTDSEAELLLETIKNKDDKEVRKQLKLIMKKDDNLAYFLDDLDIIVREISTITEHFVMFFYYIKEELTENEIKLLTAYEYLVSLHQENKELYEKTKMNIVECLVRKIEFSINEHTIRIWNDEIVDVLCKKLKGEDIYMIKENKIKLDKYIRNRNSRDFVY